MNSAHPTLPAFKLGDASVQLIPHYVDVTGARVFFVIDTDKGQHEPFNATIDEIRTLAMNMIIACDHAEAKERAAERKRRHAVSV